jgi:hypothetical protein
VRARRAGEEVTLRLDCGVGGTVVPALARTPLERRQLTTEQVVSWLLPVEQPLLPLPEGPA